MELLSIVLLSEGNTDLLARTLESLRGLSDSSVEIIVTGQLEQTGVLELLVSEETLRGKLRYLALPAGEKPGVCLNAAARLAKGRYLTFLREGAALSPMVCGAAAETLDRAKGAVWCYSGAQVGGTEEMLPPINWPDYKKEGKLFSDLISERSVAFSSVVMTKEQIQELGGFDEDLPALAEEEFLLRLAQNYPAVYLRMKALEVEERAIGPEEAVDRVIARCFLVSEFLPELYRLGLTERVVRALLEEIDEAGAWETAEAYLAILREDAECWSAIQAYFEERYPQREIQECETENVSGVRNCVGCGACSGVCPENVITMEYDEEGFLYPKVDENRCTRCSFCLYVCPAQQEVEAVPAPTDCYALQAEDRVRMGASSGGVFPVLARHVLSRGGYVAGAVFDKKFRVHHVVSDREKEIQAMQTSKYVQSDTSKVYPQIRSLLEEGKTVLFTGCACQVAGLRAFLQKPYENLYTMDVVCHGVPSVKVYEAYIRESERRAGRLTEVNFRKKSVFGWQTNLYLRFASGREYRPEKMDLYLSCFLSDWILRESCYQCEFKGMKYSDLTAADFWGIQNLEREFEDGKGTSYLSINTEKGEELFRAIRGEMKKSVHMGKEKTRKARLYNPSAASSVERPAFRDNFFKAWKEDPSSLEDGVGRAIRSLKSLRFDAALILHWSSNFGNALTNFGLYTFLAGKRKVLAVDNCGSLQPQGSFRDFAKRHYECSSDHYPMHSIKAIEESCAVLVVGSDQVWNVMFNRSFRSGKYYQLDFAGDRVRKVAYGASFGMKGAEPPAEGYTELYRRFDRIGVREKFGVEVCRETYGAEADWVLDPVFLPEREAYDAVAAESERDLAEPFILAYILNPTAEKRQACLEVQRRLGGVKVISICEPVEQTIDLSRHVLDFAYVQQKVTVEDFLYFYQNCVYVITDSFHGTCFSLIYEKNFMSFVNRQPDRFTVFEQFGDASSHIGKGYSEVFLETCMTPLDYDRIGEDLRRERERSRRWLEEAMNP